MSWESTVDLLLVCLCLGTAAYFIFRRFWIRENKPACHAAPKDNTVTHTPVVTGAKLANALERARAQKR